MSRMFRSAAAALVISLLACSSSLSALPLVAWASPADTHEGNLLTAVAEWIGSIFTDRTDSPVPDSTQPKEGSVMDPDGNH